MKLVFDSKPAHRILPEGARRALERSRFRRHARAVIRANGAYLARYGFDVRHGPFAGLRFPEETHPASFALVAKLLGVYECELHAAVCELAALPVSRLVNIGCAEGYYAAGLALKAPQLSVTAYDTDPHALARCARLAELNDVSARVELRGTCTPQDLAALPERGVALICDCEGCEAALLDPEIAPPIRHWPMLIELHDHVDSTVEDTLITRFKPTHEVEIIRSTSRRDVSPPELDFMSKRDARAVLDEYRPTRMSWLWLRPRA